MTYDEILQGLDFELKAAEFEDACGDGGWPRGVKALIAIAELHKPMDENRYCRACHPEQYGNYPCPTIQAIEKELA